MIDMTLKCVYLLYYLLVFRKVRGKLKPHEIKHKMCLSWPAKVFSLGAVFGRRLALQSARSNGL